MFTNYRCWQLKGLLVNTGTEFHRLDVSKAPCPALLTPLKKPTYDKGRLIPPGIYVTYNQSLCTFQSKTVACLQWFNYPGTMYSINSWVDTKSTFLVCNQSIYNGGVYSIYEMRQDTMVFVAGDPLLPPAAHNKPKGHRLRSTKYIHKDTHSSL